MVLSRHDQMKVRKHVKVRPGASIYDSSLAIYFSKRMSLSHPKSKNLKDIFVKQEYSCPVCENKFILDDLIELRHVLNEKKKRTGKLQWVHAHCHDQIHS